MARPARSAPTSLVAAALAVGVTLLGLLPGGAVLQLLWLAALMLTLSGLALGFVGLTVARAGSGRLPLSVLAMAANAVALGWLLVVAADRF